MAAHPSAKSFNHSIVAAYIARLHNVDTALRAIPHALEAGALVTMGGRDLAPT